MTIMDRRMFMIIFLLWSISIVSKRGNFDHHLFVNIFSQENFNSVPNYDNFDKYMFMNSYFCWKTTLCQNLTNRRNTCFAFVLFGRHTNFVNVWQTQHTYFYERLLFVGDIGFVSKYDQFDNHISMDSFKTSLFQNQASLTNPGLWNAMLLRAKHQLCVNICQIWQIYFYGHICFRRQ